MLYPSSIEIKDEVCTKINILEFLAMSVFNVKQRQSLYTEIGNLTLWSARLQSNLKTKFAQRSID